MKKRVSKAFMSFIAMVLLLSTFGMGAAAQTDNTSQITVKELPVAELFGDIELSSSGPTTVIVELEAESIVEAKQKGKNQSKDNLKAERQKVINALEQSVEQAEVNREYDYVFSGFSVELAGTDIMKLATIPGVKAVYPNVNYTAGVISVEELSAELFSPEMVKSAPFIGANDAWEAGFTGEGVTVAVIDTGVDYTHPDLVHAFGDYKGWDFVDDDNDPQEGPTQSHGTHVSGTVAANGVIKGVAPDASLLGYRVLGPDGGTTEDVVAGIERAVQDGVDVMNLSLGNPLNNPDWATSIALDWAMAEGVVAVTSNGNSGPDNWTVGSPGTSREAISVGATQLPFDNYDVDVITTGGVEYESDKVMGYEKVEDIELLDGNEFEFVFAGLGSAEEFAEVDAEGKIALISRGAYAFVDKAANAKAAGAVGAIIFNHSPGEIPFVIPGMDVPTVKITNAEGLIMLAELEAGNNTVTLDFEYVSTSPEVIADFSSRGPVALSWMIKPDVSAPGVNIVSTFPGNSYASLQGTSMASPHVAGAAALLLQKNPHWDTEDVKAALMNTAENLVDPASGEDFAHNTQGAGSIRVVDALDAMTLVAPGSHSFGKFIKDNGKQVEKQFFEIQNLSDERKTYSFDVTMHGNPDGIKVMLSNNLEVQPGSTQEVNFHVQVDTSKLEPGYYEGTIEISDGEQIFDVPTILFVGEPDYPRVTGVGLGKVSDDMYTVESYLPGGAEVLQYDLYEFDASTGTIGGFIDTLGAFENVPAPLHEFSWDGTVQGGIPLPNGDWVLAVYVESNGVTEYSAFLVTKE
ncbi:S8 family serine peptidase [Chengkuizengella sp. SCS-71B]|uniref:S8 family serine peptidase n=1 Tax=Chengkuizengella sp. SCS-71B TaxID=3115290 RepID=UPI0032C241BA